MTPLMRVVAAVLSCVLAYGLATAGTDTPQDKPASAPATARSTTEAGKLLEAASQLTQKDPAAAEKLYEQVALRYPGSPVATQAMWRISQICHQRKDADAELRWLEKCAATDPIPRDTWGENGGYARPASIERLAHVYFAKRQWKTALKWAQAMEVYGWCGNGAAAIQASQKYLIAACQLRLGQTAEAMATIEPQALDGKCRDINGYDYRCMILLCDYARENGKLDELEARLKKNPWKEEYARPSAPMRGSQVGLDYIELTRMVDRKDPAVIDKIKSVLKWEEPWQLRQAYSRLLARMGSKEALAVMDAWLKQGYYFEWDREYVEAALAEAATRPATQPAQ